MTALEVCLVSPGVELRFSVATRGNFLGDSKRVILAASYLIYNKTVFAEVHQFHRHKFFCRFSYLGALTTFTAPGSTPGEDSALPREHHCVEEGTRNLNDVVLEKLRHHGELRLGVKDRFSFKAQLLVLI